MPEEFFETLEQLQITVDLLGNVIDDLKCARNALESNLSIFKNPFNLVADGEVLSKEIKDNGNKAQIYMYMACNKIDALVALTGTKKEDDNDEKNEELI